MNQLAKTYKNFSNIQLIDILANKADYTPIAIETAELELANRHLTEDQLNEAKLAIEVKRNEKSNQEAKSKALGEKAKKIKRNIFESIDPMQEKSPDKVIKGLCVFFGLMFLYNVYMDLSFLSFIFTDSSADLDMSVVVSIIPLIYLPTLIILFWKKSKIGWGLLSIWLSYSIMAGVFAYIAESNMGEPEGGILEMISLFLPKKGLGYYMTVTMIFGSLLYYINNKAIKEIYAIEKNWQLISIAIGILVSSIQWYSVITMSF
jgi:hypothetical protein